MLSDCLHLSLVLCAVAALLAGVLLLQRSLHPPSETIRKIIHIGIGIIALPFPWLFHSAIPPAGFCFLLMAIFAALRHSTLLRHALRQLMPSVRRDSFGEFYFVLIIPLLFLCAADRPLLFLIPMLLLTFADASAALIGRRYGLHPYHLIAGHKSLEGSAAFFIVAFFAAHVPLLLAAPQFDRPQSLYIAFAIASLTTTLEALSFAGLDNLLVPLSAAATLALCDFTSPPRAALAALSASLTLLLSAIAWRKTSRPLPPPILPTRGITWRFNQ